MGRMLWSLLKWRLRCRGRLDSPPRPPSQCFYGNPISILARDVDCELPLDSRRPSDLCRDWLLIKLQNDPYPSVWQMLAFDREFSEGKHKKILGEFCARQKQGAFPLAMFFEWAAPNRPVKELPRLEFQEEVRGWGRIIIEGYIRICELALQRMKLDESSLTPYLPRLEQRVTESGRKMSQWFQVTPFAALVSLVHYCRAKGDEDSRGAVLREQYRLAGRRGELVESTCDLRDFSYHAKNGSSELSLMERFTRAIAIDRFVHEHTELVLWTGSGLEESVMAQQSSDPDAPDGAVALADEYAEKMNFQDPFPTSPGASGKSRFAAVDSNVEVGSCTYTDKVYVGWDAGIQEPGYTFEIHFPSDFSEDVYDLTVVILSSAMVDGQACQDAVFGYVEDVEVLDDNTPEHLRLTVVPRIRHLSLQYQIPQCARQPYARAKLMPAGTVDSERAVLGIHLVLGRLKPQV